MAASTAASMGRDGASSAHPSFIAFHNVLQLTRRSAQIVKIVPELAKYILRIAPRTGTIVVAGVQVLDEQVGHAPGAVSHLVTEFEQLRPRHQHPHQCRESNEITTEGVSHARFAVTAL
jgi:hypothetical protein